MDRCHNRCESGRFCGDSSTGDPAVAFGLAVVSFVLWPVRMIQVSKQAGLELREYVASMQGPAMATLVMTSAVVVAKAVIGLGATIFGSS